MEKSCKDCVFGHKCSRYEVCDMYFPVGEDAEYLIILEEMNKDREEYLQMWEEYTAEFE